MPHRLSPRDHSTHSRMGGAAISTVVRMPKPPRVDFSSERQPFTALNASLSAPPTTGTKLEMENLIARPARVSAAAPTIPCRESSPTNREVVMVSSQPAALLIQLPTPSSRSPPLTEPVSPSARETVISGTITLVASRDISSATNSTTVL